eukprot:TRINITY_DN30679_c0_g1_i2.p1 TRINITY_DN30679_c0_g1~~TRINITY_DN30679_c0_g1_i2.p1  ORF type:complete len:493 (-),score=39.49 TRINITY_DN30679_c0_g1_i2:33-1511(-)
MCREARMVQRSVGPDALLNLLSVKQYSEAAVGAAGALPALLGFLIMPLVWSLPSALVTAELSTTFPDDAGFVSWVTAAFGPYWGFQEGVLSFICAATDNAIYPALFVAYLKYVLCPDVATGDAPCPVLDNPPLQHLPSNRILLEVAVSVSLSYVSWRGLELVGKLAGILTVFMLAPFVVICVAGLPRMHMSKWLAVGTVYAHPDSADRDIDWFVFFNILFWNLSYWDTASTIAGQVANPSKNFPRALFCALGLVVGTYALPMAVCVAALPPGMEWHNGFYSEAAFILGGRFLQVFVLTSAAVSNIGQFLSEQAADSFLLSGMAEQGFLPGRLAKKSVHGTPTLAVALTCLWIVVLSRFNVVALVEMLNGVYCLAALLQFAAFLKLRKQYPDLPRPYRVPMGFTGCVLMLAAPVLMCIALIVMPYRGHHWRTVAFVLCSALVGPLLYAMLSLARSRCPEAFLRDPPSAEETCDASLARAVADAKTPRAKASLV